MLDVHWDIGATVGSGLVLCGLGISRGLKMAEREGFEPPIPVKVYTLSRRAPSATRPSLRAHYLHFHFISELFGYLALLGSLAGLNRAKRAAALKPTSQFIHNLDQRRPRV